jgi:hypothetical protein
LYKEIKKKKVHQKKNFLLAEVVWLFQKVT